MKNIIFLFVLSFVFFTLNAQTTSSDSSRTQKTTIANSYIHKKISSSKNQYLKVSNPPTAFWGVESDINKIKWLIGSVQASKPLIQTECNKVSDVYIEHCKQKAISEKKPDLAAEAWKELGNALIYRSKWDEAIKAFSQAKKAHERNVQNVAECIYSIANCHLGAGRTNECVRLLEQVVSLKQASSSSGKKRQKKFDDISLEALHWLKGENLIALDQPRWTECKVFPEPQKVTYTHVYTACPSIAIRTTGISNSDGRIRFLKKKLESKGIIVDPRGGFALKISLSPSARVGRSEGYTLDVGKKSALITARDKQGILWGIVSFLQVCDYAKKSARMCMIEDWPTCPKRGFLGRCCVDDLEFMLFNKMNINTAKTHFLSGGDYSPLNIYKTRMMAQEYNELGLELYFSFSPFAVVEAWPLSWNVFLEMQLDHAMRWARLGVGIYYPYGEARYEEGVYASEDQSTGKSPSDYDADHLLKFYTRIKSKYSSFKMQFCPPFYWGPKSGHSYPDDRDKYLRSLRKLPPEVSVFWTGERVGSHKKSRSNTNWYAELIGRKPSLSQSNSHAHYSLSYILDEVPWDNWFYNGFVDGDTRSIQKNSDTPQDYPVLSSLADYLWNVSAFNRTRAVKRGLEQYAGRDVYEALKPAYKHICRTDEYRHGVINSRVLHEDYKEWAKGLVIITNATEKVRAIAGRRVMQGFGSWERAVGFYKSILRGIKSPPNYKEIFAEPYKVWAQHLTESGYNKQVGDIVIDPIDFVGGCMLKADPLGKKQAILPDSTVASSLIAKAKAKLKFKLAAPPASDMLLLLRIKSSLSNKLSASLNRATVREKFGIGPSTTKSWKVFNVLLPKDLLHTGENEIILESLSENGSPILIEFALIKNNCPEHIRRELTEEQRERNRR